MITVKDVEHIAGLARLELTPQEKEKFQKDSGAILEFVDKLKELIVEGVEPTTTQTAMANVMRPDESRAVFDPKIVSQMLGQALDRKGDFLKVKSILHKK